MSVDALRTDTVKHVECGNLLEYVNAWKAHRPGLFVFGENLVKGTGWGDLFGDDNAPSYIRPWWYTRLGDDVRDPDSGGDSGFAVLDFGLFSTFRDNVSRGTYGQIGAVLSRDWVYGDVTRLVTFLQNHDVGPDNDFRFRGDQWMAAAYNMLWTIRRQTLISTTKRREPIRTENPAQRHLRLMWLNRTARAAKVVVSHHSSKPRPLLTWRSRSCTGHGPACAGGRSQEAGAASYSFITAAGMRPRSLISLPCSLAHARTAAVSTRWFRDARC